MATSWNSLKRDRDCLDWGREDEPLSKRINNLHLDSAGSLACGSPCPGGHLGLQQPDAVLLAAAVGHHTNGIVDCHEPSYGLPHHLPAPHGYSQSSVGNGHHAPNGQMQQANFAQQQHGGMHAEIGGPPAAQYSAQMHSHMGEMIANRELPESLSIHYPSQNPTSNPHYFVSNRVLHELHLDRLKRSGKI